MRSSITFHSLKDSLYIRFTPKHCRLILHLRILHHVYTLLLEFDFWRDIFSNEVSLNLNWFI